MSSGSGAAAHSLHPVADGGWGWLVVLGAFMGQLVYASGIVMVGVYLVYWQEYFDVGAQAVSIVATELNTGLIFMSFSGALCRQYGCRPVILAGGLLAFASTLVASFATEIWHLYIYGALAGIGHGIAVMPTIVVLRFYFKRRMGVANGIAVAGMSAGILVMAPVIDLLCSHYGWQGALMIHSAIIANYTVSAALFRPSTLERQMLRDHKHHGTISRRASVQQFSNNNSLLASKNGTKMSCGVTQRIQSSVWHHFHHTFAIPSLAKNRIFVMFTITGFLILGGYVPIVVFLTPKQVYDLGISKMTASLVMTAFGISGLVARLSHGLLLDYKIISVENLYILAMVGTGINPIFSALAPTLIGQTILAIIFGLSSGVMQSVMMLLCREYVTVNQAAIALGHFVTISGTGVIIGTQLMGKLYDVTGSYDIPFLICGAMLWGSAIIFGIVTKCTSWKPPHLITENSHDNEKGIEMNGAVTATNSSRDSGDQPITMGYKPVPTSSSSHDFNGQPITVDYRAVPTTSDSQV